MQKNKKILTVSTEVGKRAPRYSSEDAHYQRIGGTNDSTSNATAGATAAMAADAASSSGDSGISAGDVNQMYNFVEEVSRMMYSERKAMESVSEIFQQAEMEDYENLDAVDNEFVAQNEDFEYEQQNDNENQADAGDGGFWDTGDSEFGDGGTGGGGSD